MLKVLLYSSWVRNPPFVYRRRKRRRVSRKDSRPSQSPLSSSRSSRACSISLGSMWVAIWMTPLPLVVDRDRVTRSVVRAIWDLLSGQPLDPLRSLPLRPRMRLEAHQLPLFEIRDREGESVGVK